MQEKLYYCRDWAHRAYKGCELCVSELIEHGGLVQIHCIAMHDGKVLRGYKASELYDFERGVRDHVRAFIQENGMLYPERKDEGLDVKIWWYEPYDSRIDTHDICFRTAITFYKPKKIDSESAERLIEQLYGELYKFIDMGA